MADYDYSEEALNHPESRPVFLRPVRPDFDPANPGFSVAKAWWFSNLSHLAYYPTAKQVGAELSKVGLTLVSFFDAEGTQGFLADADGFSVLAFRGTQPPRFDVLAKLLGKRGKIAKLKKKVLQEMADLLTDLDAELVPWDKAATPRVHHGFLAGLNLVWERVAPLLAERIEQNIPVWYTGHSLGAALAVVAAARQKPAGLVTFGEPLVGDADFGRLIPNVCHYRVVNCCDVVTTLPPLALGYCHCGSLWFLDDQGTLFPAPAAWQIFLAKVRGGLRYQLTLPWLRRGNVKWRLWVDHTILNYTAGLEKSLP